jgi:hypothetical protein
MSEQAAISAASAARQRCICQEIEGSGPCDCLVPITRPEVVRLRAYLHQHPERALIWLDKTGEWMAALRSGLPSAEEPILEWMDNPCRLPPTADLRCSRSLGGLLDMLDAPPAAAMS